MKRELIPFLLTAILFTAAAAFITGILISPLLARSRTSKANEMLPAPPAFEGVSFTAMELTTSSHVIARHVRFTTKESSNESNIDKVFDLFAGQLNSAGWEKVFSTQSGNLRSSYWHHKEKLGGGLWLVFSLVQLDPRGEYFATMEVFPFWSYNAQGQRF